MSVGDRRKLPPFAWIGLDHLRRLREALPPQRQQGPRNALLGLAEAASLRRDGAHRAGDTLRELSTFTGVSERRLRDHLQELESIGLVAIERPTDYAGRDLPARYVLTDYTPTETRPAGSDESSDRADGSRDESSADPSGLNAPASADEKGKKTEAPRPPKGERQREKAAWRAALATWAAEHFPGVDGDYVAQALAFLPADVPATRDNLIASRLGWLLDEAEAERRQVGASIP